MWIITGNRDTADWLTMISDQLPARGDVDRLTGRTLILDGPSLPLTPPPEPQQAAASADRVVAMGISAVPGRGAPSSR